MLLTRTVLQRKQQQAPMTKGQRKATKDHSRFTWAEVKLPW